MDVNFGLQDKEVEDLLAGCDDPLVNGHQIGFEIGLDGDRDLPLSVSLRTQISAQADAIERVLCGTVTTPSLEKARETAYIGAECGDDEIAISQNRRFLTTLLAWHPKLGMKLSEKDTSISSRFGNYAEDLVTIPRYYENSYMTSSRNGHVEDMAHFDVPKIRLLIPVCPMRPDHSGTKEGKSSMMGARVLWTPSRGLCKPFMELASLYQDASLGLHKAAKPAYLPQQLGGLGKFAPFNNPDNARDYFQWWKGGTRYEFTMYVIEKLHDFITEYREKGSAKADPLLTHLVRFSTQFHDWIKNRGVYAPQFWLDRPDWATPYMVANSGESRVTDSVISRLLKSRDLVSEETLQVHMEHLAQCEALVSQQSWEDHMREKKLMLNEWRSLSIYGQTSLGQIVELEYRPTLMNTRYHRSVWEQVLDFVKLRSQDLKGMMLKSPVYSSDVLEKIYSHSSMSASMELNPCAPWSGNRFLVRNDFADAREVKFHKDLVEWMKDRSQPVPQNHIDSDEVIIESAQSGPRLCHVIVTDDRALCARLNRRTRCPVVQVPVIWYHKDLYYGECEFPWIAALEQRFPDWTINPIQDDGSVTAFEESHYRDGVGFVERKRARIFPLRGGEGTFNYVPALTPIEDWNPIGLRWPSVNHLYDRWNGLNLRGRTRGRR
jgi:hypothetical protein